jgi:hypothetical protein
MANPVSDDKPWGATRWVFAEELGRIDGVLPGSLGPAPHELRKSVCALQGKGCRSQSPSADSALGVASPAAV